MPQVATQPRHRLPTLGLQDTKSQRDSDSPILREHLGGHGRRLSYDSVSQRDSDSTIRRFVALRQLRYSQKSYNKSSVLTHPAVTFRKTDVEVYNTKNQRVRGQTLRLVVPEKSRNQLGAPDKHNAARFLNRKPDKYTPLCVSKKVHQLTLTAMTGMTIHIPSM